MSKDKNKTIESSIVVPAYNEEKYIGRFLESLLMQSYKKFEIIIVDDGSKDKTIECAKKYSKNLRLSILKQNHKGPGEARNYGARKAKGNFLVFLDADMVCDKDTLNDLITPLLKNKEWAGTVHNLEKSANLGNKWSRCAGKIRKYNINTPESAFRMVRKNLFLKAGGFDPKEGYRDDGTLAPKIGNPNLVKATIYHNNPESLKEIYKQEVWIGNSLPRSYILKLFFSLGLLLIASLLAAMFFDFGILKYIISIIIFAAIVLIIMSTRKSYKEKTLGIFPILPIFYIFKISGRISGIIKKVISSNAPK
jgi:glycosyltransferase involved in cell wall biosynthesis